MDGVTTRWYRPSDRWFWEVVERMLILYLVSNQKFVLSDSVLSDSLVNKVLIGGKFIHYEK